jgi:hypothetical protein
MLMQPSVTDVDAVGQHPDPCVLAGQQMAGQPLDPLISNAHCYAAAPAGC